MSAIISNPFPGTSAINAETFSFREEDLKQAVLPPTAPLPQVIELQKACEVYLGNFPSRKKNQGRCYLLKGENGTGKTHTLTDAMLRVASGKIVPFPTGGPTLDEFLDELEKEPAPATPAKETPPAEAAPASEERDPLREPILIYAKASERAKVEPRAIPAASSSAPATTPASTAAADGSENIGPLLAVQRHLLSRLRVKDWRSLGRDALSMLATGKPAPTSNLLGQIDRTLVDRGTLWNELAQVLNSTGPRNDFSRVFSNFLGMELSRDPALGPFAQKWLAGEPVSPEDERKIGAEGPLVTEADAAQAIQFLCKLCAMADRPLIIAIDQLEKLVCDANDQPLPTVLGLLHSIVETAPMENTLLLLAGTDRAWEAFPLDLRRRLQNSRIPCRPLEPKDAETVLGIYLKTVKIGRDETAPSGSPIFPPATLRSMLAAGGGNPRRLLQLAHTAYEKSNGAAVSPEAIDAIAEEIDAYRTDPESTKRAIRTILSKQGLDFREGHRIGRNTVDFAVRPASGGSEIFIAVSQSIYFLDELEKAKQLTQLAEDAQEIFPQSFLLIVIAGYVSPEVVKVLAKLAYRVLVFDPEAFECRLEKTLTGIKVPRPAAAESYSVDQVKRLLEEQKKTLQETIQATFAQLAEREHQLAPVHRNLETNLEKEARRQLPQRATERMQEARRAWTLERRQLEDRILGERKERASAEMAELRRLRERGEATRKESADAWSIALALLALALITWSWVLVSDIQAKKREVDVEIDRLGNRLAAESTPAPIPLASPTPGAGRNPNGKKSTTPEPAVVDPQKMLAEKREAEQQARRQELEQKENARSTLSQHENESRIPGYGGGAFLLLLALFRVLVVRHRLVGQPQAELSKEVGSDVELKALSRAYASIFTQATPRWALVGSVNARIFGLKFIYPKPHSINDLLVDPNPHFRYAGLLAMYDREEIAQVFFHENPWLASLQQEQSSIVKRRYARMAGRYAPDEALPKILAAAGQRTSIYLLEATVEFKRVKIDLAACPANLRKSLHVLHLLLMVEHLEKPDLIPSLFSTLLHSTPETVQPVVQAYQRGLDKIDLSHFGNLTGAQLNEAIEMISPIGQHGLGTADHLSVIKRIDAIFFLLRELLFYKDWGDLISLPQEEQPVP